jgi:pimeloyl-ACP methyl ester carboxylesterase
MKVPETRYAKSGDLHIAYQVLGRGPPDVLYFPGGPTQLDVMWDMPSMSRIWTRLAAFSRVILFDKRGTGLSDRGVRFPTIEEQLDDVLAVLDAARSEHPVLFGIFDGGALAVLFAATYPERSDALVAFHTAPKVIRSPDYPAGVPLEQFRAQLEGDERFALEEALSLLAPSRVDDEPYRSYYARLIRTAAGPAGYAAWSRVTEAIDVRDVLPMIRIPTLVLHRRDNRFVDVENARYLEANIPGAKRVELPGRDHLLSATDVDGVADEIEEFVTGIRPPPEPDRVLATVLFTDIVGSTERVAELGDRGWRELLERHYSVVRRQLDRYRGREVDSAGDGFLATFDGPARAIRCARAILESGPAVGLRIRAGLHTGEVELVGAAVRGIAVHIGARVAALAGPGEVLVSSTVKDLVAGSGIRFEDRGTPRAEGGSRRVAPVRGLVRLTGGHRRAGPAMGEGASGGVECAVRPVDSPQTAG